MKARVESLLLSLPPTPFFDRFHALPKFWAAHKRLPRRDSGLFNDYLYFLKTRSNRDPALKLRQRVTDKEQAKEYCREVLGRDIAPRTLALFESPEEITPVIAPQPCIIKPTHLGGGVVIFHDGGSLRHEQVTAIKGWFARDTYRDGNRVPNFIGVRHRVICEEMVDGPEQIKDYKVWCFRGKPFAFTVHEGRHSNHLVRAYTADWMPLPINFNNSLAQRIEPRPDALEEMLQVAGWLSEPFEFIRVDFYLTPGRLWFGEFCSYPAAAHARFQPPTAERSFMDLMLDKS
jgi:hypothetical protein